MSLKRYAAKRDKNEREIIDALMAAGCTVQQLSLKGVPDLLVGYTDPDTGAPTNALMEVKAPGGKLTPDEHEWLEWWQGQVFVVYSITEALEAIGR